MKFTECLNQLLQKVTQSDFTNIRCVIENSNCSLERITPYISPPIPPLNYGRNVIFQSDLFEAIVVYLPGYTETPIHDHGESICCACVVSGTLLNRLYTFQSCSSIPMLIEETQHNKGDFFYTTHGQIHSMYNPSNERLLSFHIYSPPLRNTKTYSHSSYNTKTI